MLGSGQKQLGRNIGGSSEVHLWEHRRLAHRGIEQREQREPGDIRATRLDLEVVTDLNRLINEVAVVVGDAFRWPRAAGRKNDRRFVVVALSSILELIAGRRAELVDTGTARPPLSNHKVIASQRKLLAKNHAGNVRLWDSNNADRLGLRKTSHQIIATDTWIDQNNHGPGFQQRENDRDKINAGRHQHRHSLPRPDP